MPPATRWRRARLLRIDPVVDDEGADARLPRRSRSTSTWPTKRPTAAMRWRRVTADIEAMLLGYDVDPQDDGGTLQRYLAERERRQGDSGLTSEELDLLEVFADFAELSRNRPVGDDEHSENQVHSPREHFHTYLQSLDAERGGSPEAFRSKVGAGGPPLRRQFARPVTELEAAVFRIFLAQQRSTPMSLIATALLQEWIDEPPPPVTSATVRATCSIAWSWRPSCGSRSSATRPKRAFPLVRPAGRR